MKSKAFAKINLGLKIIGKRSDGFHDIETVFAKIGLHDDLEFRLRKDSKILVKVMGAQIPSRKNLVWRAAYSLQKFLPKKIGVEIKLKKRIPLGGGLAGGSSDCAATLRALSKLWGLKLPREKLEKIGSGLGSDVAFFLRGGVQRGRGRGEILENMKLPKNFPREVLVVVPEFGVSTSEAFAKLSISRKQALKPIFKDPVNLPDIWEVNDLENDFEKVIFEEFPILAEIKKKLLKGGAKFASLSGSGSAVFGLFSSREKLKKTEQDFSGFGETFISRIRE